MTLYKWRNCIFFLTHPHGCFKFLRSLLCKGGFYYLRLTLFECLENILILGPSPLEERGPPSTVICPDESERFAWSITDGRLHRQIGTAAKKLTIIGFSDVFTVWHGFLFYGASSSSGIHFLATAGVFSSSSPSGLQDNVSTVYHFYFVSVKDLKDLWPSPFYNMRPRSDLE